MSIYQRILTCLLLLLTTACLFVLSNQISIPASLQTPKPYPDPNITAQPAPTFYPYPFPLQKPLEAVITSSPTPSPTPTSLPERTEIHFENLGLVWRDCELPRPHYQSQEDCLGVTKKETFEDGESPFGEHFLPPGALMQGWRLFIGNDVYEALHQPYMVKAFSDPDDWLEYKLFKNGQILITRKSKLTGYDPNAGLLNINGKYAWEFANPYQATVIYDDVDLRQQYGLEAVYRPYVINGKMIFVARDNGKMFVVVDGKSIGPEFDEIEIGYCCETVGIYRYPGQYWFWGSRESRNFVVVITALSLTPAIQ